VRARSAAFTGAWIAALCCALGACGASSRGVDDTAALARRAAEARAPALERAGGASTLAVPRATEGAVHVALFVDAGSRDATPPQLATAVAWIAAARTEGLHARVEPDGTEWSLECTRERLAECAAQLAGVLALRDADEAELVRVRAALADARRRALTDDGRTADALALAGALGVRDASAFGDAESDGQIDAEAIARFAAAHYGPSRALFVAAGDVGGAALREAVSAAMRGAPAASEARAAREAQRAASVDERVRVGVSESDAVSVALRVGSAGRARAIAARMTAERGVASDSRASMSAFALRGAGIVLMRLTGDASADGGVRAWVMRGVSELETARRETPVEGELALQPEDALGELARAYGRAFVTGDAPPGSTQSAASAEEDAALAVGVVVRGGRAPSLRVPDPDARLAAQTLTAVTLARDAALAGAAPELRGAVTTRAASVVLPNGARLEVRALPGAQTLALALRFSSDAASEPPSVLGRAALTAQALVAACAGEARRDGVELRAIVDAHSFGLIASARDEDALLRTLRCAVDATPDDSLIEDARHSLVASLDAQRDPTAHAQSLAARALAPETPAVIAPRGEANRIAAVPAGEVRALLTDARRGARTSVALAGDVDAVETSASVGRRLATLDAGTLDAPRAPAEASADGVLAAAWRGPGVRVIVALRADAAELRIAPGTPVDRLDARAFALALGARLATAPGVRFIAADGALVGAGAFAWVALDADEDALGALPATVRDANATLGAGAVGERAVREVRARLGAQWAASLASPAVVADALSAARIEGRTPQLAPGDGAALARVIDALAAARVRYVIARAAGR
jgi:hypothetical protein